MRLNLRLPEVKPEHFELPKQCPTADGAVAIVLESLGIGIGKTSVYRAVQAAAEKVPGMKQAHLPDGYRTRAVETDVTSVRCGGKWLPLGVSVDAITGMTLSISSSRKGKTWLILDDLGDAPAAFDGATEHKRQAAQLFQVRAQDTHCSELPLALVDHRHQENCQPHRDDQNGVEAFHTGDTIQ